MSGHVDSDSVYAGNPAKKLMTLDEFRVKREKKQLEEAKNVVLEYKSHFITAFTIIIARQVVRN